MLPPREGEVSRGVVIVDHDVGRETGPGVAALDEVVREQRVLRKAAGGGPLERLDVVDPLSGEAPLAIEILIHIRDRGRIRIHTRMPGVDRGEDRAIRARERHADARLEDAVAADHSSVYRIVNGTIERMRQCSHEERRRVGRKHGVGVESDDVPHAVERIDVAHDRRECVVPRASNESVEFREFAPLALPPHPDTLFRIPSPGTVEQIEGVVGRGGVPRVESVNTLHRGRQNGRVPLRGLGRRVGKVAQDGEMEVRRAVGEKLDLEVVEGLTHRLDAGEEDGNDDRRAVFLGHAVLAEVELGEKPWPQEGGDELIDGADGDVVGWNQRTQEDQRPGGSRRGSGEPEEQSERREGPRDHAANEDDVGMAPDPALDRVPE